MPNERSEASVHGPQRPADLAFHVTAPAEGAVAPLLLLHDRGFESPAAAHQLAAVHAERGGVAVPAAGSRDGQALVFVTEVRARLVIDQILLSGRLVTRVVALEPEVVLAPSTSPPSHVGPHVPCVRCQDSGGSVEPLSNIVTHFPETGKSHPASLHGAGSGHPVALAFLLHF